jgi:hypothetical protein
LSYIPVLKIAAPVFTVYTQPKSPLPLAKAAVDRMISPGLLPRRLSREGTYLAGDTRIELVFLVLEARVFPEDLLYKYYYKTIF